MISATREGTVHEQMVLERVGSAFSLLMQVRMLIAAITLGLIPAGRISPQVFVLVALLVLVSWQAARRWRTIVPWLLRRPALAIVDVALSFVVLGVGGSSGPFLMATVATAGVAGLLFGWRGMLVISVLQIAGYYTAFALTLEKTGGDIATFQTVLGQPVYYPLAGYAGVAMRRLFDQQTREALARARAEARAAAADERGRLAREMHDSLAKTLHGIAMAATALPIWVRKDAERALEEAVNLASATAIASREARTLLDEMRTDNLTRPLAGALRETAERWASASGVAVRCDLEPEIDVELRKRSEVLSILSEVLANVERHAAATSVDVRLTRDDQMAILSVRDNGRGFRLENVEKLAREGHYGLIGLRERAERAGGTVVVGSEPGVGTTIVLRLPVEAPVGASGNDLAEVG
ncbi:histidine kinase [Spirillospora sp. NBC_00431]